MPRVWFSLKLGLIVFWAVWSGLVFAANLGDALRSSSILPADFAFVSGNLSAVQQVTEIHHVPSWLAATLFGVVVAWNGLNTTLFCRASWRAGRRRRVRDPGVPLAFTVSLGLWACLMVADELFLSYRVASFEQTHRGIFTAMLVSLVTIFLLPDE